MVEQCVARYGRLDIIVSGWDPREPLRFLVNDGEGGFVDRSNASGLGAIAGGVLEYGVMWLGMSALSFVAAAFYLGVLLLLLRGRAT